MRELTILNTAGEFRTQGLLHHGHPELVATVTDPALAGECEAFLRFVVAYVLTQNARIEAGQTLAYGYWVTQFHSGAGDCLEAWELSPDGSGFTPGVDRTVTYWRNQHRICVRCDAEFQAPLGDRLVVVSDGVFEGDAVEGVRYPSPEHMSGWWITTDRYTGDAQSLRTHHLYHLTAARPELAQYLALPYGYRFHLAGGEDIWFDPEVARQPPV